MGLQVSGVTVSKGGVSLVRGMTGCLPTHGVSALVGPNGAGKSTLLRVLGGVTRPTQGDVLWRGRSWQEINARERARLVAFMPERVGWVFDGLVQDVLLLGRRCLHKGRESADQENAVVHPVLDRLHISHLYHRRVATLSSGEWRLVMVARCLVQEAPILLLDEPFGNLDPGYKRCLQEAIEAVRHACCIVISLHEIEWLEGWADVVWAIQEGQLVWSGPRLPESVKDQLFYQRWSKGDKDGARDQN